MELSLCLEPGDYVLAISGGIDSMVLLDMCAQQPWVRRYNIVVAHFDHGIREESAADAQFVAEVARRYGFEYRQQNARLGKGCSEAVARDARYAFLDAVADQYGATVVTAHHKDDVLETCLLQLVRGTGWRGLAGLGNSRYRRPLVGYDKAQLVGYAIEHGLEWHEDATNDQPAYLRNRLRMQYLPRLSADQREQLFCIWREQTRLRGEVDQQLSLILSPGELMPRYLLIMVPWAVGRELVRHWLSGLSPGGLQRPRLDSVVLFARTARPCKILQPSRGILITATLRALIVTSS